MTLKRTSRRFYSILLTLSAVVLLNVGYADLGHAGWWFGKDTPEEEAYKKSREEFETVQNGAAFIGEKTSAALTEAKRIEGEISARIRELEAQGKKVPAVYKDALSKAKECQKSLGMTAEVAEKFGDYSGKVTTALDVVEEIGQVHDRAVANMQAFDELGGALSLMADTMNNLGEKVPVPLIGTIISGYGKITSGTLDALRQVSATIKENRNQDQLGEGIYDRTTEKGKIFKAFRAEQGNKLPAAVYAPSSPAYLYVPAGHEREGYSALWDEEAKQFTLVPPNIPAKSIYRMNLMLERETPPKASELKTMMVQWNTDGAQKLKTARNLLPKLNGLRKGEFADFGRKGLESEGVYGLLDRSEVFEARYVYDAEIREKVHRSIKKIHDDLMEDGSDLAKARAAEIRKWAGKLGLALKKPEPPKPEKKTVKKDEPSTVEGFFKDLADGLDKINKDLEKLNTTTSAPQKTAAPPPSPPPVVEKKVESKPTPSPKPAVKAGGVVGTCSECRDSGLDCACGKAACRCCAPGDSSCNAFDL